MIVLNFGLIGISLIFNETDDMYPLLFRLYLRDVES